MTYDNIMTIIDGMAEDFLFLNSREVDIPSAGKFLNQLETISKHAADLQANPLTDVAGGMSDILEKIIIDTISDKAVGFAVIEKGISLLQEITNLYQNTGNYDGTIAPFMEEVRTLTGYTAATAASSSEPTPSEEQPGTPPETIEKAPAQKKEPEAKMEVQDESLLRDFITEALEYIEEIEVNILNLEQNPDDKEIINTIFRPFHSVKGVAGFLNLDEIRDLSHCLENLLDKARNGALAVTAPVIDVVLDGADTLKSMIGALRDSLEGRGVSQSSFELAPLKERITQVENGVAVVAERKKVGEILVEEGVVTQDKLDEGLKIAAESAPPPKKIGEVLIDQGAATPKQVSQALRKQADQVTDASTIRVDTRKLDDLIDMVGELVITHSIIQQDIANQIAADRNLMRDIGQLTRITAGLQQASTILRMIPIKQTFQRMSRLVRDLAKGNGKIVSVEMVGEDTEIDRNMVDEIYNPLVHMVRNSVDHGLEPPEERVRLGKSDKGLIQLKAYHRGGNIVIEISDDGKGLNREKLLAKAIKTGKVQEGEELAEEEIYRLIFLPGLSTAEKITDVSGRGVGMDVVKQAVDKLRGKIEIKSIPGKGTTLTTSFPLTMAIIDGMIVRTGTQRFILPTTAIRQALRPSEDSYTNVIGKGELMNVMGNLLPLVRLSDLFAIEGAHRAPWEAIAVVVEAEGRSKCLLVDEILGKAEVVIKSLGDGLKNIQGIAGGAILGDGQIGLILDAEGLFAISEKNA